MADLGQIISARLKRFKDKLGSGIQAVREFDKPAPPTLNLSRHQLSKPRVQRAYQQSIPLTREANRMHVNRMPVQPIQGSSVPRFNLGEAYTNPQSSRTSNAARRIGGDLVSEIANAPSDVVAGLSQFGRGIAGRDLDNIRTGGFRTGLGAFNFATTATGPGAAARGASVLARTGLREGIKRGAITGSKLGAAEGFLRGGIAKPGQSGEEVAQNIAMNTMGGALGGGVLGSVAGAIPSTLGMPRHALGGLRAKLQFRDGQRSPSRATGASLGQGRGAQGRYSGAIRARKNISAANIRNIDSPKVRDRVARQRVLDHAKTTSDRASITHLAANIYRGLPSGPQKRDRLIRAGMRVFDDQRRANRLASQRGAINFGEIGKALARPFRQLRPVRDAPGSLPQRADDAAGFSTGAGKPVAPGRRRFPSQVERRGYFDAPIRPTPQGGQRLSNQNQLARSSDLPSQSQSLGSSRVGGGGSQTRTGIGMRTPDQDLTPPPQGPARPYTDIINNSADITPSQKVGIQDYLKTPDRVLEKIGLKREADLLREQYNKYAQELPQEIARVSEWAERASGNGSNKRIFQFLDGQNVQLQPNEKQVATEIQQYLAQWADRLGLPKDRRIAHYITHIFDEDFIKKEFDPELAKIIRDKVPGQVYDPFLEQRLGKQGYIEDTWRALDAYVKRATRKANMDPALAQVKSAAKNLEESQFEYVKRLTDKINLRPGEIDNLVDNTIKQFVGYRFGGRPVARISRNVRNWVYRGTLGLNVGSAIRNLTQVINTYSKLGEKYSIIGYTKLANNMATRNLDELTRVGVLQDNIIQDRKISAIKSAMQKLDPVLWAVFDTAEKINRGAAYYGAKSRALAKGLNEEQAIKEGLKMVRDTQFTFGSIDTPVAMQNDIVKIFTQFQSFSVKQAEFLSEMIKNKEFAGMARFVGANAVLLTTIGQTLGYDWKDAVPFGGILSGETKLGATPPIQLAGTLAKFATGGEDQFGQPLDLSDVGKSVIPFIPAGVQGKKTIEGVGAAQRGFSQSKSGRARFPVGDGILGKVQAGILGQYSGGVARFYFDNKLTPLGDKDTEQLRQRIKGGEAPNQAYYNLFVQRMARSQKPPEEKERLIEGLRRVLGIHEAGASETTPQTLDLKVSDRKLEQVKEIFKSDMPEKERVAALQAAGVTMSGSGGQIGSIHFWVDQNNKFQSVDVGQGNIQQQQTDVGGITVSTAEADDFPFPDFNTSAPGQKLRADLNFNNISSEARDADIVFHMRTPSGKVLSIPQTKERYMPGETTSYGLQINIPKNVQPGQAEVWATVNGQEIAGTRRSHRIVSTDAIDRYDYEGRPASHETLTQDPIQLGGTAIARAQKSKEIFSTVRKLLEANISDEQRQGALQQLGVSQEDAEYYSIANLTNDIKSAYVLEDLVPQIQDHSELMDHLAMLRKEVGGKMILANGVIDDLYDEGIISSSEKKWLKSLETDRKTGKVRTKKSTGRGRKPPKVTVGRVSAAKVPQVKATRQRRSRRPSSRVTFRLPPISRFKPQQQMPGPEGIRERIIGGG